MKDSYVLDTKKKKDKRKKSSVRTREKEETKRKNKNCEATIITAAVPVLLHRGASAACSVCKNNRNKKLLFADVVSHTYGSWPGFSLRS